MTGWQLITSYWRLNIPILVAVVLLIFVHLKGNGYRLSRKSLIFFSGLVLLFLVTFSSLNFLGQSYLFSAHMIQHIVLLLIVPPLLLAGTDSSFLARIISKPGVKKVLSILFYPVIAWLFGIAFMWITHIPAVYGSMKNFHILHIIIIFLLLIAGLIFAWPVFAPIQWRKISPLQSVLYLFTACVGCTVLGILITFAPVGTYTTYLTGQNATILNLIHLKLGITPNVDQQTGGLIMWVPACIIYITDIMITLAKWYRTSDNEQKEMKLSIQTTNKI
jgi:putative membrane protein